MLPVEVRDDDRILYLGLPALADLREILQRVTRGMVVAIGGEEAVRRARRELVQFDNVLLLPAADPPEPQIPWRDEFFTKLIAAGHCELEPEMLRVVAPGGVVVLGSQVIERPSRQEPLAARV